MKAVAQELSWSELNQQYLTAALNVVRGWLEEQAATPDATKHAAVVAPMQAVEKLRQTMSTPPALEVLCATFGLSPFERALLLLCAGIELDARFAALCAKAHGDPTRGYATFGLALAALPEAHWSALTPKAPLRYWRLIETSANNPLTTGPLRIDERILHYLAGVPYLDERLAAYVEPVATVESLAPSHQALVRRLCELWSQSPAGTLLPAAQLCGSATPSLRAIAAAACAELGLGLYALPAQALPLEARELEAFLRLWQREAILSASALLLDCGDLSSSDTAREYAITQLIEHNGGVLLVTGRERRAALRRRLLTLEVQPTTPAEQQHLWMQTLGAAAPALNGQVETLVAQFHLDEAAIAAACAEALGTGASDPAQISRHLWAACRRLARPQLENLAQRIEALATWADLVLPKPQLETLQQISSHVQQRSKVYADWGFAAKSSRGLGISALFAGASGTGKTMAAEVLANDLKLDLYRIDLSQVVSKYIGETEKNLRRVFDAAEQGGAILLFDEADALFGKRSEVRDSHDRYANVEISYLLQRMEEYSGLAILTTNLKEALDPAFLRRIRFVVHFPFPDATQRSEIWRRIFPAATPTAGLDADKLARLNVAGGNIRNIALQAAFAAAHANEAVGMAQLLAAARGEYAKLEKPLTGAEIRGWL